MIILKINNIILLSEYFLTLNNLLSILAIKIIAISNIPQTAYFQEFQFLSPTIRVGSLFTLSVYYSTIKTFSQSQMKTDFI